jgi:23S rRNA (guanosine2251-2'-O)-methyltransferase
MENFIYGIQPVLESLKAEQRILQRIFIAQGQRSPALRSVEQLARKLRVPLQDYPKDGLTRLVKNDHHQGVVGVLADSLYASFEDLLQAIQAQAGWKRVLIVDVLEDPQNLGSLIRTAEACGVAGIILPKDRSVGLTPSVIKASAGAIAHIPVVQVTNLTHSLEELKKAGFWIVGADARAKQDLYGMKFDMNVGLVIGSESKGIRPLVLSKCDFTVAIPMKGKVSSLNAAIAGAVILFEILRQDWPGKTP